MYFKTIQYEKFNCNNDWFIQYLLKTCTCQTSNNSIMSIFQCCETATKQVNKNLCSIPSDNKKQKALMFEEGKIVI